MDIFTFVYCVLAVGNPVRYTLWGWDEAGNILGLCACTVRILEILQVQLMQKPSVLGTVEKLCVIEVVLWLLC